MNASSHSANSVFGNAVEIESPEDRRAYLDEACAGNAALRADVDNLLQALDSAGTFMRCRLAVAVTTDKAPVSEQPGTLIGPYKLLEQIGEGGMGMVYVAEQTEPVRRRVALKIIKPGMDTKHVIARFEAERQALAMMDHPHIAKVLDAGTTDAGRPYFVMELVRGLPVTEYCDKARLSPRQRLELFIDVCHAVQHAHQKGVIHRDLKPSNVMITVHDGRPVAKVIDFGVAKAVGQQLTERTVYTAHTQLVGTPLYMSPEQADFSSQDVDTRSDVYSLGVLLYELLTGQTPFDKETLHKSGFDEMRRIIREDEPPCPSRRFSTLSAQAISTVSQHRSVDERHLGRVLRGELDWIVMKALEKDRSRRYESASALAADIQRYLSDEPVLACPPTTMYRFQKLARKHRPALVTAAAIAACLILGTTVSAWQAVRATTAEAQAEANEQKANANADQAQAKAEEATQQRDEAQKQRDEVRDLNHTLQRTLYAAHMNLAQHAWEAGGPERAEALLLQHRPKPGDADLRGFEWHYLHRLCHPNLVTLNGHSWAVTSTVFSPDGERLASASEDNSVKVWDAQTGKELLSLSVHDGYVSSVAFSPDSKRLAGSLKEGGIRVWDPETGKQLLSIDEKAWSAAFSPDGKRLACAMEIDDTATVKVLDALTGQKLLSFEGHTDDVNHVVYSPDGKRLAGASGVWDDNKNAYVAGEVKVWDAQTGKELLTIKGHTDSVMTVDFSPDGKRLASAARDKAVKVWDAETGEELASCQGANWWAQSLSFSPDGKRLASADGQAATVWDAQTGERLLSFYEHTLDVSSVAISPDGKRLASASYDRTVKIRDISEAVTPLKFKRETSIASLAFSPDVKRLASTIWDITAFVPGQYPAATPTLGKVWDARTGQEALTFETINRENGQVVAFSPDGKQFAAANPDRTVKLRDVQTGQELMSLKVHIGPVWNLAFSPDGARLATSSRTVKSEEGFQPEVKVWDARTGQEILSLVGGGSSVAFSPDSKRLAAAVRRGVKIWDAQTGQELLTTTDAVNVWSLSFSPDGMRLACISGGQVKIWNTQTGESLPAPQGHTRLVFSVVFSPDGKRLATGSHDKTVRIWDSETCQQLVSLEHEQRVKCVAFSPDGHLLASGTDDGTVTIFDATPLPERP